MSKERYSDLKRPNIQPEEARGLQVAEVRVRSVYPHVTR